MTYIPTRLGLGKRKQPHTDEDPVAPSDDADVNQRVDGDRGMMDASLGADSGYDSDDHQGAYATANEDDFSELNGTYAFKRRKLHFQATDSPEQVRGTPSPDNLKGLPPSPPNSRTSQQVPCLKPRIQPLATLAWRFPAQQNLSLLLTNCLLHHLTIRCLSRH
ncbi:uncharacterized protein LY79DRAFT_417585 [Colletotrichum navitas]|uniref:Uncharacterized protein n=1 Tax=Colletotrichum navitas TaxID=681940 RepID=A0AAD8UXW2_9PEZI|nr:uncharacterized protein LY79DRAFT_417585 [Colletotrichum navitas]KAK1573072.1 hypothetical protein LY79DRAFT_417585 [Colletotrichum navitas]